MARVVELVNHERDFKQFCDELLKFEIGPLAAVQGAGQVQLQPRPIGGERITCVTIERCVCTSRIGVSAACEVGFGSAAESACAGHRLRHDRDAEFSRNQGLLSSPTGKDRARSWTWAPLPADRGRFGSRNGIRMGETTTRKDRRGGRSRRRETEDREKDAERRRVPEGSDLAAGRTKR
jgi:hypothetical protein